MHIKRNIKKRNPAEVISQPRRITSNNQGKYKYPIIDEVPPGHYFSKIDGAAFTITSKGKDAVEVLYELKDYTTCYKIATGMLPEDTEISSYYIKQTYPEKTQYYDTFADSMAEALGAKEFLPEEVINITEYVTLAYDKSTIGGFTKRFYLTWEEFVEICKSQEEKSRCVYECCDDGYITPKESPASQTTDQSTNTEVVNEPDYDEDDEFDDFLDDDWDD